MALIGGQINDKKSILTHKQDGLSITMKELKKDLTKKQPVDRL